MTDLASIDGFTVSVCPSIHAIPAPEWDACAAGPFPCGQHRHLCALEDSGVVGPSAGSSPRHLLLKTADGAPVAVVPTYLKTHSSHELGVDLGLPMAHQRVAGPYYPKLQVEIPLTPTEGPRLMVRPDTDPAPVRRALIRALLALAEAEGAHSVQITHISPAERDVATALGFLASEGNSFFWTHRGAPDFDTWVAGMGRKGRARARQDLQAIQRLGLTHRVLTGPTLPPDGPATVYRQYRAMYAAHATPAGLNQAYFEQLFRTMSDHVEILAMMGETGWMGAFFCLRAGDRRYAQHWLQETPRADVLFGLMFHVIADAMAAGITRVDFGPLGQHKTLRGIDIEPVHHALWFRAPAFRRTAEIACTRKTALARHERDEQQARLPFPRSRDGGRVAPE